MRLTDAQRQAFARDGYLVLPAWLGSDWLDRLNAVMNGFIADAHALESSSPAILVEPGHRRGRPRLRRIPQTVAFHPVFEEFGLRGPPVELASDLLGENLRFHHSKLNFKWRDGGEEIRWHQDIQFWPHTNYSLLTVGVYLVDVDQAMGPMGVFAGSHRATLSDLRDEAGRWTGALSQAEVGALDPDSLVWLTGPRGTVTIHHCRLVHGSAVNRSRRMRPLLLHTYAACDALPVTGIMDGVPLANTIVRGRAPDAPRHDPAPCPMPPTWAPGEYSSIFASQRPSPGPAPMDS